MPPLRLLSVAFDTQIEPWELRQFRGAIARKVGLEHDRFHNHDNETGGLHYRYPLIQYKFDRKRPLLVCINDGVEEMHHFFSMPDWSLGLDERFNDLRIARIDMKEVELQPDDVPRERRFHLRQWLALNDENYLTYQRLDGLLERTALLEKVLNNHLVALCYGCGLTEPRAFHARILEVKEEKWARFKDVRMLAFSLVFAVDLCIPDFIGLGKGASVGWGVVRRL